MKAQVRLTEREEVAEGTMAFHFEKPSGFEFRAGQFVDFVLNDPPETDEKGNTRGFSFVQAPFENEIIVATRMRDTAFKRVLKTLPLGTELTLKGPFGDFRLHKNEATPAVFLAGGIGITPVCSILKQAFHDKVGHKITLFYANRTVGSSAYLAEFEEMAKQNPNFTFVPVVSEGAPADWKGETGRIDGEMIKRHVADVAAPIYYITGPEGMVKAMREALVSIGADEDNIRTEEFGGY